MENLIYNELRLRGMSVDVGVVIKNEKDANGVSVRKQYEVDLISRYQDDDGITYMNIYEFLLNEDSL